MSAISPKADVVENKGYVRFVPKADIASASVKHFALLQEQGTSNPSPFAVLRLIDITNFVGNCTGNSAGLVPLSSEHRPLYVVGQPQSRKATVKNVTTRPFATAPN
jgi:hypothetical protein